MAQSRWDWNAAFNLNGSPGCESRQRQRCITVRLWQCRCGMNQNPNRRQMRWWMPAALIVIAIGIAAYLRSRELPFIEPILIGIGLLTALLIGAWYIFFTGLRWKTRMVLLLVSVAFLVGIYFGVKDFTRIDGSIGGSGIPRLVWKWSPKEEGPAQPLTLEPAASTSDQS